MGPPDRKAFRRAVREPGLGPRPSVGFGLLGLSGLPDAQTGSSSGFLKLITDWRSLRALAAVSLPWHTGPRVHSDLEQGLINWAELSSLPEERGEEEE